MIALGRAAPVGLSVIAVALTCVIALDVAAWRRPPATSTMPPVKAAVSPRRVVPAGPDPHVDWFNQILARPLFNPDRHPIDSGVRGLPRLTGIVVAGSQRVAIFAGPAAGHPVLAQAGARIGAYEVRNIADEGVTVVGPAGTSLVRPAFDPGRPGSAEPAKPANLQPGRPLAR